MSHNNVKFCFGLILTLIMLQTTAPALVIQDSQQTSTNGSYVAFLGCDGDMDTFSLTNNAVNQFWSMTLRTPTRINWIFVSTGTGTYTIDVSSAGNILSRCANISESSGQNTDKMERIITCRDLGYILGRVIISSSKERHLKIYEVDIIGTSQLNKNMILNFSDIMDTASRVLDNNLETYYNSEERSNASWFVRLDAVYALKWILISIRGGQFEIHISVGNTATNLSTRCKAFELAGPIKRQQTAVECDKVMNGDTLIVKKIDAGSLRLFEVYLIICPENHFGPNCARCRQSCWSCDSITGECTQCNGPYYGEYCQYRCPANCLNLTCDQRTGSCNGCEEGFEGKSCEHEITTQDLLTVCPPNHFGQNCEKCRQKCRSCDSITGECTQCQISFYGKNCLHRCPINCFDLICDRKTGVCNGCLQGYKGRHCEQNIATSISTTTIAPLMNGQPCVCNHSCVTCEEDVKVCSLCTP